MRTYISLTEGGARLKERLAVILPLWERYRAIRDAARHIATADGVPAGYAAAAVFDRSLEAAKQAVFVQMRENEQLLAEAEKLSPAQLSILSMRYVQGFTWARIGVQLGIPRARLFQEHRIGLNVLADEKEG